VFIDEIFENGYYRKLELSEKNQYSFGHIFMTHAYYPHENLQLWRPIINPSEPTRTYAESFKIESAGADAFNRALPLGMPNLAKNEEFLVVRAKRRPVILLTMEQPIKDIDTTGFRGKLWRKRCLVAPVFGLQESIDGREEFPPLFVERLRQMEYPQLLFLPKQFELFSIDGMLRFDECQSVFTPHLEPLGYSLSEDLIEITKSQLNFLTTGIYAGGYQMYREDILESLKKF